MKLVTVCLFAAALYANAPLATGQEVVHALAGTVTKVNQKTGIINVSTDDGSPGSFKDASGKPPATLEKSLVADTVPALLTAQGDHVIVFYCGDGTVRSAVAIHDLGSGPVEKDTGTVTKYDSHAHVLTIKTAAGAEVSYRIDPKTVAETMTGAAEGYKSSFEKGDQVRVTAIQQNGRETALFIVPTS